MFHFIKKQHLLSAKNMNKKSMMFTKDNKGYKVLDGDWIKN